MLALELELELGLVGVSISVTLSENCCSRVVDGELIGVQTFVARIDISKYCSTVLLYQCCEDNYLNKLIHIHSCVPFGCGREI